MALFDWKAAIVSQAVQIEGARMAQRMFPKRGAEFDAECNTKASYAAWLARSYFRKGRARA